MTTPKRLIPLKKKLVKKAGPIPASPSPPPTPPTPPTKAKHPSGPAANPPNPAKFAPGTKIKWTGSSVGSPKTRHGIIKSVRKSRLIPKWIYTIDVGNGRFIDLIEDILNLDGDGTSIPDAPSRPIVLSGQTTCPLCGRAGEFWVNKILCSNSSCRNHRR